MNRDNINPGDIVAVTMRYERHDLNRAGLGVFHCAGANFTLPVAQVERIVSRALRVDSFVRCKYDHALSGIITAINQDHAWVKLDTPTAVRVGYAFITARLIDLEPSNAFGEALTATAR